MDSRVRDLFLQAMEQPEAQRLRFVRQSKVDETTRREVENLLENVSPATVLRPAAADPSLSSVSGLHRYTRYLLPFAERRWARWLTRLALLTLLVAAGQWLRREVRQRAEADAFSTLRAVDESHASSFQNLLFEWRLAVEDTLQQGGKAAAIEALRHPSMASATRFHQSARQLLAPGRFTRYYLVKPAGESQVLNGALVERFGATPYGLGMIQTALKGTSTLTSFPGTKRVMVGFAQPGDLVPLVTFFVPLWDQNIPVGVLIASHPADRLFQMLLRARFQQTGEAYLFALDGVMLSPSRFLNDVERLGLLAKPNSPGAVPYIDLRDPGRRLADTGLQAGEQPSVWPLTLLVRTLAAASKGKAAGFSGVLREPYRDFRGEMVVSAWRWMPELQAALATEVDAREVFATVDLVDRALLGLLLCLGAASAWGVISLGWLLRWSKRTAVGRQMGAYSLIEKIGEGGMGEVYLAQHNLLRRSAALKLLRRDRYDDLSSQMFEAEARVVSRLRHPNTVELYDFGRAQDGTFYYAMQYLPGLNLAEWVKRHGPMPQERTIHVVRQICSSLAEAHEEGVLHSDVKPSNVMLCSVTGLHDFVKLLDFGLATSLRENRWNTTPASFAVTPYYTAPERLDRQVVDARSDLYSLGALWFFLLTGLRHLPQQAHWVEVTLHAEPLRVGAFVPVDLEVDQLVSSCLARNPDQRPASALLLLERLDLLRARLPWTETEARGAWAG